MSGIEDISKSNNTTVPETGEDMTSFKDAETGSNTGAYVPLDQVEIKEKWDEKGTANTSLEEEFKTPPLNIKKDEKEVGKESDPKTLYIGYRLNKSLFDVSPVKKDMHSGEIVRNMKILDPIEALNS